MSSLRTTAAAVAPSAATAPDGPTGRLATWLASFKLEDTPVSARECAKTLILDGIACALVGAQLPWSRRAVEIVRRLEGTGSCSIVGWGEKISAPAAALLNGTFIQGFELDDFHPLAPLHSASLILPALWATIECQDKVTGRDFLEAVIAGCETGPRVGLALHGAQMLSRGWHSGSVFGTHAAAAGVGKLLRLNAAQFEDALGLAGTQSAGLMAAQYEAMSKRMHHGLASRNGLYAAMLAQGGYTGIKRVFEREYGGFLSTFGEGHAPDETQIANELGIRWEVERIVIKSYAAMGGIHSPLDALFEVEAKRSLKAEEIRSIECDVSHAVYHHGWWELEYPLTPIGAQMNIGYALAVAVLDGAAMIQQFSPNRINQKDIWALLPRISVRHDPAFDIGGVSKRGQTRVTVNFNDGEKIVVERAMPRIAEKRQSFDEVARKYRTMTVDLMDSDRQANIEKMVCSIEDIPDMRSLMALLGPVVGTAFVDFN